MYEVWESKDDEGDQIRALKMAGELVRLVVRDTGSARYYLSADERRGLAMFLLDGLEGGDATAG